MVEHAVRDVAVDDAGFTVEQWLAFDGAGDRRVELIDGTYVVSPAPAGPHQLVVNNLLGTLVTSLRPAGLTSKATGMGVVSPDMRPEQGLIPDVLVTASPGTWTEETVVPASEAVLAVEVLSPWSGPRDRVRKLELYARMGIPHYWLIDPRSPVTITALQLQGPTYAQVSAASGEDFFSVEAPFRFSVRPSQLREA